MCGRTACTQSPECMRRLCAKKTKKNGEEAEVLPSWLDDPGGNKYYSSFNMPPSKYSPVLISAKQKHIQHLVPDEEMNEHHCTIQPMHWGLIPSWHRGEASSFGYKMNNARSDSLLSKASFRNPLQEGRRCAVLADGYFEWQTCKDGRKLPYFLYFSENSDVYKSFKNEVDGDIADEKTEPKDLNSALDIKKESVGEIGETSKHEEAADDTNPAKACPVKTEQEGYFGTQFSSSDSGPATKKLLSMAGVFDVWESTETGERVYSYAIVTVDAHQDYQFIHDRMPAILSDQNEVDSWLDPSVPLEKALQLIRPTNKLSYHPVSTMVNNSRERSPRCIVPAEHEKTPSKEKALSRSGDFMMSWLTSKTKRSEEDTSSPPTKKIKKV